MRSQSCMFLAVLLVSFAGCDDDVDRFELEHSPRHRPRLHQPTFLHPCVNPIVGREQRGKCVHASLTSHLRWENQWTLAEQWRRTYNGGEYDSRLRQRLDAAKIPYAFTREANPAFLDWCHATRRGCILWWKPSHCCTFLGWIHQRWKTIRRDPRQQSHSANRVDRTRTVSTSVGQATADSPWQSRTNLRLHPLAILRDHPMTTQHIRIGASLGLLLLAIATCYIPAVALSVPKVVEKQWYPQDPDQWRAASPASRP